MKLTVQRGPDKKTVEVALERFRPPAGGGGGGGTDPARPYGSTLGGQVENRRPDRGPDGNQTGGVYKSTDGGETWTRINSLNPRPMYFSQVRVDPSDDKLLYVLGVTLYRIDRRRQDVPRGSAGNAASTPTSTPCGSTRRTAGTCSSACDGGFYVTYDRGDNWDHLNTRRLGQFYHVAVDNKQAVPRLRRLAGQRQLGRARRTLRGTGPVNEDWIIRQRRRRLRLPRRSRRPGLVYAESQDGAMSRRNLRTGESGAHPAAARGQGQGAAPRSTGTRRSSSRATTPASSTAARKYVFRSLKQGDNLKADLAGDDADQARHGHGDRRSPAERGRALGRHRRRQRVGDQATAAAKWTNVTTSSSAACRGRAGCRPSRRRSYADGPVLRLPSTPTAPTTTSRTSSSPRTSARPGSRSRATCRRSARRAACARTCSNPNLLYCGTEFGICASINRGEVWTKINNNLPTVAVHEVAQPPDGRRDRGRDARPQHVGPGRRRPAADDAGRGEVRRASLRLAADDTLAVGTGRGQFDGQWLKEVLRPESAARGPIYYSLGKKADKITLKVVDYAGQTVREMTTKSDPGLHKVMWDLRRPSARTIQNVVGGQADPEQAMRRGLFTADVPAGQYRVVLTVDGKEFTQGLRIDADPTGVSGTIAADGDDDEDGDADRDMDKDIERDPS